MTFDFGFDLVFLYCKKFSPTNPDLIHIFSNLLPVASQHNSKNKIKGGDAQILLKVYADKKIEILQEILNHFSIYSWIGIGFEVELRIKTEKTLENSKIVSSIVWGYYCNNSQLLSFIPLQCLASQVLAKFFPAVASISLSPFSTTIFIPFV